MSLMDHAHVELGREPLRFKSVRIDWHTILAETCREFGLTREQMLSSSRVRSIAWPRFKAMYRMRHEARMSFPRIGHRLGFLDHTSVVHGVKRYTQPDVQAYFDARLAAESAGQE